MANAYKNTHVVRIGPKVHELFFFDDRRLARRISVRVLLVLDFLRGPIFLEKRTPNTHGVGIGSKVHELFFDDRQKFMSYFFDDRRPGESRASLF